jgi:Tat protein secretion system quality control protein TatD with DNase activity
LANKTIRPRDVNEIVNLLAEIKEMPPNVIAEVILSNQTTLIEKYRPNK